MANRKLGSLLVGAALVLGPMTIAESAMAQGASIESANAQQKADAQKAFTAGMKAQKAGKHEEALAAFKESYNAVASPNPHLMMARELVELNRLEEAWDEYERVIPEAEAAAVKDKKYNQTATQARTEMNDLKGKLGFVKISVKGGKEGDRVTVRGREISDHSKPVAVAPGTVKVELQSSGGGETSKEVTVAAGSEENVELVPGAPPTTMGGGNEVPPEDEKKVEVDTSKPTSLRTWAYVAGGVGIAGFATFAIFGIMNNSKHKKLEDECNGNVCSSDLESDRDAGKTYQTIANIGLGVGIVGVAAGTVLFIVSSGGGSKEKSTSALPKKPSGPRVDRVDVGYRSVVLSGSF